MDAPYDAAYAEWKRWHGAGAFGFGRKDAKYFRGELAGIALAGARVLEIGFGNGHLLAWLKSQGARATGTELLGHAVELGRERGYDVHPGRVYEVAALESERFDLIVAIDVLEHLDDEDFGRTLAWIVAHLSDTGVCLARVPNAASPFGLGVQHGDLTHRQQLSCEKFRQLSHLHGFEIVACRNQYRSWAGGLPALRQSLQRALRAATERYLRFILELREGPLDMNLVAVFRRRKARAG
jgi:2-polyprenyl-3-methyl-5-hydroxy-6-metoxy-1,4-benzoquinol methylase